MDVESKTHLEFLLTTLDNLNDAILVLDQEGKVLYTNHGFAELFKPLVGDIVDWSFEKMGTEFEVYDLNGQFLPPDQWPFIRIMKGEKVFQEKLKVILKSNNRTSLFIQISGGPIKQANNLQTFSLISISDITTQESNYLMLQEKEESYRKLFHENPQPMWILDPESLRFLEVNNAALAQYGYSKTEFHNLTIDEIIHEEDLPQFLEEIQKPGLPHLLNTAIRRHHKKNGEIIDVEVTSHYLSYQGRNTRLSMPHDITARKRAEKKLIESEEKLSLFVQHAPAALAMFDREMRYIAASRRWLDDNKVSLKEIIGAMHYDIVPDISDEWKEIHRRALNGESDKNKEDRFVRQDGSVLFLKWEVRPWYNAEKEVGGIIIITEDITERKLNEEKLIESEKRFANIFYDSPVPIAITRLVDGEIILVNPSVTKFIGFTRQELIGRTTLEMKFWKGTEKRREFIEKIRTKMSVSDMETAVTLKSGEIRHVLMWGELIEYYGEECILLEIIDITEKKIQEEKIKLQNEKINAILYSLPDKLFIHDAEGTFLEAYTTNPDGYIMPKENFIGKKISDVFPEEIAALNLTYLKECLQKREPVSHEFSTDYKGTYSTFEVRIVPFMDNLAIRFVRDITRSKENEKEIFKLQKAIDENPIAIVITDRNGNLSYTSRAFETTTGYSNEEILGRNIRILDSGKHPLKMYAKMWETIESGEIWEGEMINRKKDGTFYWVYLTISPLYEQEKQITGYLAVQQDITEKKKNEQKILELNSCLERRIEERTGELQSNQEKLMLSQKIAQMGIWEFSTVNDVVKWSEETYRIFDRSPEKEPYSFQEFLDSILPGDRERFVNSAYSMTGGENLITHTLRHYTDEGNLKWVKYYMKGIMENGEATHFLGTLLDITAEKQTQLRLEEAVHEAEEANKAKSIFLANMSHEIRTPLNSIIGFSELLYSTIEDDKKRSQVTSIRDSGRNLLRIINDILDLSKVEAGKMIVEREPMNVYHLVSEVCSMFEPNIKEKNLHLTIEHDKVDATPLLLDETRLRQILFNLVGNAIKFTFRGGISVGIHHEEKEEKKVDLKICIRDTGMGISEDQLEAIFEPFVQQKGQTQKAFGGTGLGLTISRRMAEAMGGEISVKSKLNEGSEFTLLFKDIAKADFIPENAEKNFHDYTDIRFEESTILIVDDNEDNRKLLLDALNHTGAHLLEAGNGLDAVRIATEEIPDIILMDKRMPVMDGREACKRLKENPITAGIVCVGVSATLSLGKNGSNSLHTFDDNIIKPISLEKLFELLIKYLKNTHKTAQSALPETETTPVTEPEWSDELRLFAAEELVPLYHHIMSTQLMDEMEDFGRRLVQAGRRFGNKKLIDTGNRIVDYADQFEVEKLTNTLKQFNLILNHEL